MSPTGSPSDQPTLSPVDAGCLGIAKRISVSESKIQFTVRNPNGNQRQIDIIRFSWPESNGNLVRVTLIDDVSTITLFDGSAPPNFFEVPEAGSQGSIAKDKQKVVEFTFAGIAASGPYLADIKCNGSCRDCLTISKA